MSDNVKVYASKDWVEKEILNNVIADTYETKENVDAKFNLLSNEKIDKTALSLGIASDNLIYLFVDGSPVGTGIPQGTGETGDLFGYIDENNTVVLRGDLIDGNYTIKYEMDDGSTIDIGNLVLDTNVYYSITKNLTQCTISNSATQAVKGESYSATITANSGYELSSVEVTMGGNPVTANGGTISIAEVTGDIVITAAAEEVNIETNFAEYNATNTSDWSIWINNARAGSDGAYRSDSYNKDFGTPAVSNYVAVQNGDVIEFTAIYTQNKNSVLYDSTKTPLSSNGIGVLTTLTTNLSDISLNSNDNNYSGTFTINNASIAYVRIGGYVGTPAHPAGEISIKIKRNGEYL